MPRLREIDTDLEDLYDDPGPADSGYGDLAGDDPRFVSMGRQSRESGKTRLLKDKHGRPVNRKAGRASTIKSVNSAGPSGDTPEPGATLGTPTEPNHDLGGVRQPNQPMGGMAEPIVAAPGNTAESGSTAGALPEPDLAPRAAATGMVCKKTVGRYWVNTGGRIVECAISSLLRKQLIYPIADPTSMRRRVMEVKDIRQVDPVAIGDIVRFVDAGEGEGLITEVLPRKNKLVRRAAGPKPLEQVIVANVDQIITIVAAANPMPKWEVLDRFLAASEWLGVPAVVCLTKLDLGSSDALMAEVETYRQAGYRVLLTSVVSGEGIHEFKSILTDKVSVLVGPSGVGKTSLLNTVQPGLGQRVSEVSASTNKGRHTTTHLELFPLDWGGSLIDTPGMREFGLWDVKDAELATTFAEMRPLVGRCQFGLNCRHLQEPGCAIKQAVASGRVSERRYESYLKLRG
ncbi:MAG: Small ribosomal subunit biosis GTPase RsgA [Chloroflexi bacterium]|nr:Small ribosomal subunit biosis GTPase RsgA [Chloroflexota bacterium]